MKILRYLLPLALSVLAGCATGPSPSSRADSQPYVAADTSRTVDLTHPPRDMWDRIRRGFAIPNLRSDKVDHWTDYYASHPQSVLIMSQRAGKYLYYIVDELNRRGLPTELALLPFIESAYNPNALSRSQASGLWQFIPSTGLHYNLQQDWWRDQRRDPVASTQAALDYLSYLYDFQGDWYLALASYNWGEGAVKRAMDKAQNNGLEPIYTQLAMPDETSNYVPKLQAIKNIIARPEKYGITLPVVSNTPYFTTVHKSRDMDIAVAAALAEMPLEDFQALNPAYNRPMMLAEHQPALHLPLDKVDIFNDNLKAYTGRLSSWQVVHPKRGQSLAGIAKTYGITLDQLRQANNLGRKQTKATAAALLIPMDNLPADSGFRLASYGSAAAGDRRVAPDAASDIRIVQVAPGEAGDRRVIRRVTAAAQPGGGRAGSPHLVRRVVIPGQSGGVTATAAAARVATPPARVAHQAAPSGAAPVRTHTVRRGDTLYALAKRYNTSVDTLRQLNNLKGSALSTGKRLRVPGAQG